MEKLITVTNAADHLGVTKKTLQDWDRSGKLVALRTAGGHRRYRQSDIEKLQGIERETLDRDKVVAYCRVISQDQKWYPRGTFCPMDEVEYEFDEGKTSTAQATFQDGVRTQD